MKPIINKSRLMKDAHRMRKYEGMEMSIAMKLAWISEKKKVKAEVDAYLWAQPDPNYVEPTKEQQFESMANACHNYYASKPSGAYTGD